MVTFISLSQSVLLDAKHLLSYKEQTHVAHSDERDGQTQKMKECVQTPEPHIATTHLH